MNDATVSQTQAKPDGGTPSMIVRLLVNVGLLSVSVLITLVVAEFVVRLVAPQQLILKLPDVWTPDSVLGHRHRQMAEARINTGERAVWFITDDKGYRVGQGGHHDGDLTILLLGDSFMEALQVDYEQSLAGLLEERLQQASGRSVVVRNTAVGGWDPDQYLIQARKVFQEGERVDLVLVSLFVSNDVIAFWRDSVPARVPKLVHSFRIPTSFNTAEFIDALLYPLNDALEVRSHLFILFKNRLQTLLMRAGLTAAKFEPVFYKTELSSKRWANTADICAAIASLAAARGVPAIFFLIPASYQVDTTIQGQYVRGFGVDTATIDMNQPNRVLGDSLRARGLNVLDALPVLRQAFGTGAQPFGRVDRHLSAEGHLIIERFLQGPIMNAITSAPGPH